MTKVTKSVGGTTTGLAVIDSANTSVPQILDLLDTQIKSLDHIKESNYKTTGTLEGFGDIKAENKVENMIRAFSMVIGKERAYNNAAEELGLSTYPAFSISGGNAEQWKNDIQLRMAIITHKEKLDKLNDYKAKMSKFLSEQDQKAMIMQDMAKFLTSQS